MKQLEMILDVKMGKNKFESLEQICEFENKYKIELPCDYKQFLLQYGSSYVEDGFFYKAIEKSEITPEDEYDSADYFYGNDLVDNMDVYSEEFKQKLVPIANANGGDYICIGVKDEYKDKVYYWMHESSENMEESLSLIAHSFADFIDSFEEREVQETDPAILDDIELEMDDDLWND